MELKHRLTLKTLGLLLPSLLFLGSCGKDDPQPDGPAPAPERHRTVLFYMMDDHDLWQAMSGTLNSLEAGWDESFDGNLLVYLDPSPRLTQFSHPVLLRVVHDETAAIRSEVVREYPDQDPADAQVMRGVLESVIEQYPARSHGLIIGTHGSAWFPAGLGESAGSAGGHDEEHEGELSALYGSATRSLLGSDSYGTHIEIDELARLLPVRYDFLLFHACQMSNVETAYRLRDKCRILAGSEGPLPWRGLSYDTGLEYLFAKPQADFYHLLTDALWMYKELPGDDPSLDFDMAIIRTDRLDALASAAKPVMDAVSADLESLYARFRAGVKPVAGGLPLFDLANVVSIACGSDPALKSACQAFENALEDAVLLHGGVPRPQNVNPEQFDTGSYCGLSCYVPFRGSEYTRLNACYRDRYGWARASGFDGLVTTE